MLIGLRVNCGHGHMPHTVRTSLTTWVFQKKLNDLSSAGNGAMRLSRKQFWDGVGSEGQRSA